MDKERALSDIFSDDPLDILAIRVASAPRTADERLLSSFQEINDFYVANGREPGANQSNITEYQLHARLNTLRESINKTELLEEHDQFDLLKPEEIEINSIDDIFNDNSLDILSKSDEGLFNFEHTPKQKDINKADFVARRKPCKDFGKYESKFIQVQKDLVNGKRKLIRFKETLLKAGNFYVNNGILLFLESIDYKSREWSRGENEKNRIRKFDDGRTRIIFENGTESNMYLRSLGKALINNGKAVTANLDNSDEDFLRTFNNITNEDDETGFIYVLKSNSMDEGIASIFDLHKIGYSKNNPSERIKNAEHEPTYLMAPVSIVGIWQCFNMNPQKFEQLLHNFFGKTCLDLDVFDDNGKRHRPREWFIVPIDAINQAIEMIINGVIVNYKYSQDSETIVLK